jgi:hypothetical protein
MPSRVEPTSRRTGARPWRRRGRALAGLALALSVAAAGSLPGAASAATTWSRNLFTSGALVFQDPYYTACTAAAVMTMLNTIAHRGTGGQGFSWTPSRVKSGVDDDRDMVSILAFERANDTLRASSAGSDAHGWRNALNQFGWGPEAMTDPAKRVYDDRAYATLGGALRAAVRAIARREMPVGILAWAGGHAQVMTGYVVTGDDPRVSSDFTVTHVYLSDPLRKSDLVNRRLSVRQLREGALTYRFQRYRESDSPYDDRLTAGVIASAVHPDRGASEWYRRWVVILPIRSGLPTPDPDPDPTPTPEPTPTPDATPDLNPTPTPEPTPEAAAPEPAPTPTPTPTPASASTPTPTATPVDEPAVPPEPTVASEPEPTPAAEPSVTP